MNSPAKSKGHLSGLDSVRGLAIVLVVIFHYIYNHVSDGWLGTLIGPFGLGGVTLFFFLSGFLMERHLANDGNLLRYFSRRFFRILPAYLVCLAAVLLLEHVTHAGGHLTVRDVTINALLIQDFFGTPLVIGVIWTLLIEIKFYVFAPFVMRGGAVALRLAPYATVAVNATVFLIRGEGSTFLTYLTFCFVGMQFGPWSRGQMSGRILALPILIAAVATSVFASHFPHGLAIFVLFNATIMAAALRWSPVIPILPFIGKVSYSWYLYHAAIGYPLVVSLTALLGETAWTQGFIVFVATIVTLFIAWLSFTIVERPMVAFGYRLEQHLGISQARPAAKDSRSNT
jgi:peptidoglycan/LPS O-acetylase OafA/YrhL